MLRAVLGEQGLTGMAWDAVPNASISGWSSPRSRPERDPLLTPEASAAGRPARAA